MLIAVVRVAAEARPPARSAAKAVSGQLIVGFERKVSADRQGRIVRSLGAKLASA